MGPRRASTTAVAAVAGTTLLLTLLVGWASSVGPRGVLTGDGPERIGLEVPTPTESPPPEGPEEEPAEALEREAPRLEWLRWVALLLEVLLAVAAAYLLWRGGRWASQAWQARRRPDPPPPDVEFDVLGSPQVLVDELAASAERQRAALLATGSPRNAVVEAWQHFEDAAARVGAVRKPWETSSEFILRLLEAVQADDRAVARLAVLYREARFSEHAVTEEHRAEALAALDSVHASLRAGSPA